MPSKHWGRSIKGVDDVELGIPRASALIYHCTAPESIPANGLVFVIPDFNDEANEVEFITLREHLANTYGMLAVTVEYHCYRSRLRDAAQFDLTDDEFSTLRTLCAGHIVALADRKELIPALKQLPIPYEFEVRVMPANGDYQNLGVMQALDHLAVLHDLRSNPGVEVVEWGNVVAIGNGYGGYLANLIAKFAPNALRAIVACDAYTSPPSSFIFGGQAGNFAPYYYHAGKVRLFPLIQTKWTIDATLPGYFSLARSEIRDLSLYSHLATMRQASQRSCQFRFAVSTSCSELIASQQRQLAATLQTAGFDIELLEQAVPGADPWATSGISLSALFDHFYPSLSAQVAGSSTNVSSSVAYLSGNALYCLDFDEFGQQTAIAPIDRQRPRLLFY